MFVEKMSSNRSEKVDSNGKVSRIQFLLNYRFDTIGVIILDCNEYLLSDKNRMNI
jgi:hypothetical protein